MSRKGGKAAYDDDDYFDDDHADDFDDGYDAHPRPAAVDDDLVNAVYDDVYDACPAWVTEDQIVAAIRAGNYSLEGSMVEIAKLRPPAAKAKATPSKPATSTSAKSTPAGKNASGGKGGKTPATVERVAGAAALQAAPGGKLASLPSLPAPDDAVRVAPSSAPRAVAVVPSGAPVLRAAASSDSSSTARSGPPIPPEVLAAAASAKQRISVCVLGHVDAGKSTLMGHMLFDLGCVPTRALQALVKQSRAAGKGSFAFAWILDQDDTERARGVTIDVARNHFETAANVFTLLDAPGHRDFIPNTLTAIAQADVAILVVDATPGEFEMSIQGGGQAGEHATLARNLGISTLIVAVNKMDGAMVRWSQERFTDVQTRLMAFLKKVGFRPESVTFVPVSGLAGVNVVKTLDASIAAATAAVAAMAPAAAEAAASGRDHRHASVDVAGHTPRTHIHYAGREDDDDYAPSPRSGRHEGSADDIASDLGFASAAPVASRASTAVASPAPATVRATAVGSGDAPDYTGMDVLAFTAAAMQPSELQRLKAWYTGGTLMQALDAIKLPPRMVDKPLRVCISDVYKTPGQGLMAAGRVEGGWVADKTSVAIVPPGAAVTGVIKSVIVNGAPVAYALAGDNVDLALGGFDEAVVLPGRVLCPPSMQMRMVVKFKAQIMTFAGMDMPLVPGQQLLLHTHTREEPCIITRFLRTLTSDGHTKDKKPRMLLGGVVAVVRVRIMRPVPLDTYAEHKRLGRFILRYGSKSIGAGMVLKIKR